MDEEAFADKVIGDLRFAASVSEGLLQRPTASKQLLAHREITRKLIEDPVFFAVLMCGDTWLVEAADHQKLLRDLNPRQVAVRGRGWGETHEQFIFCF